MIPVVVDGIRIIVRLLADAAAFAWLLLQPRGAIAAASMSNWSRTRTPSMTAQIMPCSTPVPTRNLVPIVWLTFSGRWR